MSEDYKSVQKLRSRNGAIKEGKKNLSKALDKDVLELVGRQIELGLQRWTESMIESFEKKYGVKIPLAEYPMWNDFLSDMKAIALANYVEGFVKDLLDFLMIYSNDYFEKDTNPDHF